MAYLNTLGDAALYFTPAKKNREIDAKLDELNTKLDTFFQNLLDNDLLNCINLLIVSDHGVQPFNSTVHFRELTLNQEKTKLKVLEPKMDATNGPLTRIHLDMSAIKRTTTDDPAGQYLTGLKKAFNALPSSNKKPQFSFAVQYLMKHLECYDKTQFLMYDRKTLPKRYHYETSSKTGDILLQTRPNVNLIADEEAFEKDALITGACGYDVNTPSMQTIFLGRGPNIKASSSLPPFQNVELYNLFSALLGLKTVVKNDGTQGFTDKILQGLPPSTSESLYKAAEFISGIDTKGPIKIFGNSKCLLDFATKNKQLAKCETSSANIFYSEVKELGVTKYCDTLILRHKNMVDGYTTMIFEQLKDKDFTKEKSKKLYDLVNTEHGKCFTFDTPCNNCRENWKAKESKFSMPAMFDWQSLMANTKDALAEQFQALQAITRYYTRKYKSITSITGTIYDFNKDGLADTETVFREYDNIIHKNYVGRRPSHIFRILMRCGDNKWQVNGKSCVDQEKQRVLSFVLPVLKDFNCLNASEILSDNTARIRDIELLTGVQFFQDQELFKDKYSSLLARLHVPVKLWMQ
uniref:Uncharacterized protein n=1 Tax=Ditylenchus dipsaci TaxID=166011 RepID=A0A915DFV8_9BILA